MTPHEHDWSDWFRPVFYRDLLGTLLRDVGMGRLSGTDDPATSGWVRACRGCDTQQMSTTTPCPDHTGDDVSRAAGRQAETEGESA